MTENVPERLGRYRILAALGAGGMGVVYRAYDDKLRRSVAIKLLHRADDSARTRLLHEARMPSALSHPGICAVYELEDRGDQAFIVMELVEGQRLGDVIAGGLPFESTRRYGLEIAEAMAHAHASGIVHGDLKPSNIVVTPAGRIKILDFGLAQLVPVSTADLTTVTQAPQADGRVVAGTLAYMAPEQLRGERATTRSDVWSLGVVLYEMATGRRPFGGETSLTLSATILATEPPALPAGAPVGLRQVIARCLKKSTDARYRDAGQVHAGLDALGRPRRRRTLPAQESRRPARRRIRSIAVLPLENLSADPEQEYFADGMTDALISTLAQIGALRVISRTSIMRYKGARRALPEIARELDVDAVVEGTVIRSGDRIRIIAQLIHAARDEHLWSKAYERHVRDVLDLQSDIARAVADEIRVQLSPHEEMRLAGRQSVEPAAYEAYLKGRHHWYRRTPQSLQRAVDYMRQAIELDPSSALAHAGLADAWISVGWDVFGLAPPRETYPQAREAALKALEIDPHCAEAHAALGWAATGYDWDWSTAERELRRAIELKPQYGPVHIWLSHLLHAVGRTTESYEESLRALDCDPLGLILNFHMGWHHLYSRQYDRAAEQLVKMLELDPSSLLGSVWLGLVQLQLGKTADAVAAIEHGVEASGRSPLYLADLAYAYAVAGRRANALAALAEVEAAAERRYVPARAIAEIHLALDDRDRAFDWLERALVQRNGWLIHIRANPRYDGVRDDHRYVDLVRRLNLPQAVSV